ncbi:MAG TPA: class I SAM-dependent methyltransferase [Kofleriaceae bacterium]|nr:class I SAM-dependent methyltransferase [Kofleriaceae bacterium]
MSRGGSRADRSRAFADHTLAVDLGAHEHYRDAALYDFEYRRRRADVRWYVELAARLLGGGGRILELGCGSGRVTVPLARAGHQVTALDHEPAMLAALEERRRRLPAAVAARIEPVQGDLRTFALGRRFDLVLAAFNVVEHLYTRVEVDACFRAVRRHLRPDGRFAFDVQLPDLPWLARDASRRWARTRFTHPVTGEPLYYSTNHDYDPVSQICVIRLYYTPVPPAASSETAAGVPRRARSLAPRARGLLAGSRRRREEVVVLSQRKFFPAELEGLVAHAGLRVVERYGDFDGAPLGPGADSQVLVCAAARPKTAVSRRG